MSAPARRPTPDPWPSAPKAHQCVSCGADTYLEQCIRCRPWPCPVSPMSYTCRDDEEDEADALRRP